MTAEPGERIAYLGPAGTFTEAALDQALAGRAAAAGGPAAKVPMATVGRCFDAVRTGEAAAAVVPIENSLEGGVNATLDALSASDPPLVIVGEQLVPVTFVLAAREGTELADVHRVASHPHAEAQCRAWLADTLPAVTVEPAMSTAAAAAGLALTAGSSPGYDAAICAPSAVERYGLATLATDIGDRPATTRFVVVSRPGTVPAPTGADRTSIVAYLRENHSGALLELLEQFASRGVDLTRIESRPTGAGFGEYCFSIDLDGHVAEPRVAEALRGLRRLSPFTRFLGSYPKADGRTSRVLDWTDGDAFDDAERWLAGLLGG
ncbi:prephenate dehydratase [Aquipuribacter sp. SD81]|uniref:prephenate dehydratase n=1 Tax=Aquipuribacter sp. SD81 TaxID=3127703 RepID=UPI003016747B